MNLRTACGGCLVAWAALATAAPAVAAPRFAWGGTPSASAGRLGELFGVAAAGPEAALAVGAYNPGEFPTAVLTRPYAERWDGTAWTAVDVAVPRLYASQSARLHGVAMLGPSEAWAVGHVEDIASLESRTLAYRWDGSGWTRVPTPNPARPPFGNHLNAVAAADGAVYAAGDTGYPARSMLLRWTGSAWATVPTPDIGVLSAVAIDAEGVWVAGPTQVQRRDASGWSVLPALPVRFDELPQLAGLARSGEALWAVGTVWAPYFDGLIASPYAARWQDGVWLRVSVGGGIGNAHGLSGVAATADGIRATGTNGMVWRLTAGGATADAVPLELLKLNAIAAGPDGRAWAAGLLSADGVAVPALVDAPGLGEGGLSVSTGYAGASVTWTGPESGSGITDVFGRFVVGGLPAGSYTVIAAGEGCRPGIAPVAVAAGRVKGAQALVQCP